MNWRGVRHSGRATSWLLATAVFVIGTDGFVFAGLLPELAEDVGVSLGRAGQVTTAFALAYAVAAPLLGVLTQPWSRRRVLVLAFGLFVTGNLLTAVAPNFSLMLFARTVAAAGAALITPSASVIAASLAAPQRRARAIATVTSGLTVATALGAPLGTFVAGSFGWRSTVIVIAALGAIVGTLLCVHLADAPGQPRQALRIRLAPLADAAVRWLLVTTLFAFVGVYLVYTYAAVMFRAPLDAGTVALAALLFAIGSAGVVGNLAAGRLSDSYGASRVVAIALIVIAIMAPVAQATGQSAPAAMAAASVYGVVAFAITGPQQHRLIGVTAESPGLPLALNASVIYVAVASAGGLGGWVASHHADRLGLVATASALLAVGASAMAARHEGELF